MLLLFYFILQYVMSYTHGYVPITNNCMFMYEYDYKISRHKIMILFCSCWNIMRYRIIKYLC